MTFKNSNQYADAYKISEFIEIQQRKLAQTAEKEEVRHSVSLVEAIKQHKELLDMDAITQEEFDTKKKQLIGL